jgi:nascent polypeptide-associated complex subunit alpha
MFGGGGMNPRKMKQMMEQMGIDLDELDAEEVVIRTADEELVFTDAQVTRMDAQGQQTYQVVGSPESRPRGETDADASAVAAGDDGGADAEADAGSGITDDDVRTVAEQAGASKSEARDALEAEDGDLAAAIMRLS